MSFDELAAQRKQLQLFCYGHARSLRAFSSGSSYKVLLDDKDCSGLCNLTSTATCIESLLDCPARFRPDDQSPTTKAADFAKAAIERPHDRWRSEESASIYCRCRGLPLTIKFLEAYDPRIGEHIERILAQVKADNRFAIGEADPDMSRDYWYPPNAFHTYWALEVLRVFNQQFTNEYEAFSDDHNVSATRNGMLLWARQTLGLQNALHAAESSVLDTDQLAWALATLLRFEKKFPVDLRDQDLLRESLKQLFSTQLSVGTWRHYRSLFHYQRAGNAYCYVFETFAALLGIAVEKDREKKFLRDCLFTYRNNLHQLLQYAESTKTSLSAGTTDTGPIGWCSGHRLNQTLPESWATASVFAFAQAYRRLLGVWTREWAASELNVVKPRLESLPDQTLKTRGETWILPPGVGPSVSELLYRLYINPVRASTAVESVDADDEVLEKHQARSAILFGPPGASKTTLARALALRIQWQYIEIHATHFVSKGMNQIHTRADEIFRRLMELDHTVILFDEIDELVREREGGQEAFGRFLTTSMLPKLAELWQQRKTLYFVATNHMRYFDRAITRSERFDSLILVALPSYRAKVQELSRIFSEKFDISCSFDVEAEEIWGELKQAGDPDCGGDGDKDKRAQPLREDHLLAKFILLRWDQLSELAAHLHPEQKTDECIITKDSLRHALKRIKDRNLAVRLPYLEFIEDLAYPRRDYDKHQIWEVRGLDPTESAGEPLFRDSRGNVWLKLDGVLDLPDSVAGRAIQKTEPGQAEAGIVTLVSRA